MLIWQHLLLRFLKFVAEFKENPHIDILIADRKHRQSLVKQTFIRQKISQIFGIVIQQFIRFTY